jgi:methyl-accepting chemotaxis protein
MKSSTVDLGGRRFGIGGRVIALSIAPVVLTITALVMLVTHQTDSLRKGLEQNLRASTRTDVERMVHSAALVCQTAHEGLKRQLISALSIAEHLVVASGGVALAKEEVGWEAVDQVTRAKAQVRLPKLLLGSTWLGQNRAAAVRTDYVDDVRDLTGTSVTLFQRMNESGDMLRVATNVVNAAGARAIGTFIPAKGTDGAPNPVIGAVLRKEKYFGRALVVDAWYVTGYAPIFDSEKKIVGMVFVGVRQDSIGFLRDELQSTAVGKSGHLFALVGSGEQRGQYALPPRGTPVGQKMWDERDAKGDTPFRTLIQTSLAASRGQVVHQVYPPRESKEAGGSVRLAAVTYFEPWDWVVGVDAPESDFLDSVSFLTALARELSTWSMIGGAIVLLLAVVIAVPMARRIAGRLTGLARVADSVSQGDLRATFADAGADEVALVSASLERIVDAQQAEVSLAQALAKGDWSVEVAPRSSLDELSRALGTMIQSVNAALEQSQRAADQVTAGATEISDASHSLSEGATEQAASVAEITGSMNRITSQASGSAQSAAKASELTAHARESAQRGKGDLGQTVEAMEAIATSGRQMAKVVKLIDDIAFQVQLLSLNAAVEAARAGRHGKGFAVVAEEVRNLAGRCARAAQETTALIDDSVKRSEHGLALAHRTAESFSSIESEVHEASELVRAIAQGSQEQADGIAQLTRSLSQVDEVTQRNSATAEETASSSKELAAAALDLQRTLHRFRLRGGGGESASGLEGHANGQAGNGRALPAAGSNA